MAKTRDNKEQVVDKIDFVALVNKAELSMGSSTFLKIRLDVEVTKEGLDELVKVYSKTGYEVFANGKDVLLLKQ